MQHQVVDVSAARRRRFALALLTLMLAASLLPAAAADHVYSHRLVVTGRILGADGMPVAGTRVALEVDGVGIGGPCLGVADAPTTPRGDFTLCRHAHEMPLGTNVTARVEVQGESFEAPVDLYTRRAVIHAVLDEPSASHDIGGQRELNRTISVVGRLYLAGEQTVENMRVHATALAGHTVEVRLIAPSGILMHRVGATTGENGDFAAEFEERDAEGVRVEVRFSGDLRETELDPRIRRADVDFVYERPPPDEPIRQPGTGEVRTPAPSAPLLAAAVAGALVVAALGRRLRG